VKNRVLPFFLALTLLLVGLMSRDANAITFGKEEVEASAKFPWAVQIYYFDKNSTTPSGLCTGTLIKPDVVLTAAHCVPSEGTFQVKYGATTLEQGGTTYAVDGAWRNPRYSQSKFGVNDVGLLKLKTQIPSAVTLPLASVKNLKLAEKSNVLNVYGWGEDQNGELSTYLRSASITNQSAFLSKLIGKNFNSNTWIAAGKYNKIEKVYAGGCRGDSGGPLVATYKGKLFQVGITSFGAENCETAVPTIFMKVSYFVSELNAAVDQLYTNSVVTDRSPPENLIPPSITGSVKVGSIVTCQPGQWSKNVSTLNFSWSTPNGLINRTGSNLQIDASMTGLELKCTVTATSRAGELQNSVQITVPSKPIINSAATISGLPKNGYEVAAVNNLSCNSANTSGLVDSSTFYWLMRNSTYDTSGTNLGNSSSLSLPSTFFEQNNYKDLVCVNVITGPGGEVKSQANGTIYAPQIPTIYSVSVSGLNNLSGSNADSWIGTNLVCSASTSLSSTSATPILYSWKVYDSLATYTPTDSSIGRVIGAGPNLTLTESILRDAVLKRIGCVASVASLAGTARGYSSVIYVDYRNIVAPDVTPPTFAFLSISPFNGPSYRLRDPFTIVFTAGDASGLSANPFSFRAILNRTKEIPLTINGNRYAYPGGTAASTKFEQSFILPGIANGGELGSYQILIGIFDSKSNYTGWQTLASFEVTGERTN
jgi:V8-like Glu-specific endopeptidase